MGMLLQETRHHSRDRFFIGTNWGTHTYYGELVRNSFCSAFGNCFVIRRSSLRLISYSDIILKDFNGLEEPWSNSNRY